MIYKHLFQLADNSETFFYLIYEYWVKNGTWDADNAAYGSEAAVLRSF
jgi:hypothetical protein